MSAAVRSPAFSRNRATRLISIGVAAAATLSAAACGSTGPASGGSSTLTIAVFESFSGTDAAFGPTNLAGCLVGAKEVNENGGVLGHKLTCQPVDDKSDPADAVPIADKMLTSTSNLVAVIGPGTTAPTTAPIIGAAKVVMMSGTGTPLEDHNTDPYFFRLTPSDSVTGTAMAWWAFQHGCKIGAAVFTVGSSASTVTSPLAAEYRKLGGRLVKNLLMVADQPSYQTEAAQVMAAHPQCIFTETDPQSAGTFWSEIRQISPSIPTVYGDEADTFAPYYAAVLPAAGKTFKFVALDQANPAPSPAYTLYKKLLMTIGSQVKNPAQYIADPSAIGSADGVLLAALAMNAAKSTKPSVWDPYVMKITGTVGAGDVIVHTYAQGVSALKAGKTIRYSGIAGLTIFNKYHNAASAFEALQLNDTTRTLTPIGSVPLSVLP